MPYLTLEVLSRCTDFLLHNARCFGVVGARLRGAGSVSSLDGLHLILDRPCHEDHKEQDQAKPCHLVAISVHRLQDSEKPRGTMKAAKWPTTADQVGERRWRGLTSDTAQYVLQQEIGKGATSLVYTARCPSGECAVKVFRLKELPESAEGSVAVFLRLSVRSLRHPPQSRF